MQPFRLLCSVVEEEEEERVDGSGVSGWMVWVGSRPNTWACEGGVGGGVTAAHEALWLNGLDEGM